MTYKPDTKLTPGQQALLETALCLLAAKDPYLEPDITAAFDTYAGPVAVQAAQDLQARLLDVQSRLPALVKAAGDLIAAVPAQVAT